MFFTKLDVQAANGNSVALLHNISHKLLQPSFNLNKEWGDLLKTEVGTKQQINFKGDFELFVDFLNRRYSVL